MIKMTSLSAANLRSFSGGDHTLAKAFLDAGPRVALTGADAFLGYAAATSKMSGASALAGTVGFLRAATGFFEMIADDKSVLGTPRHAIKGAGDFLAGVGLMATAAGAGPAGVAVTLGGDFMALFARMREGLE